MSEMGERAEAEADVASLPKVVLVDARPERLHVMRSLLESSGVVEVVGVADTGPVSIEQVRAHSADAVIVEIQMPVEDGLAAVAALREQVPDLGIIVWSFRHDLATEQAARDNGADGYLVKPVDMGELAPLLREIGTRKRERVLHGAS